MSTQDQSGGGSTGDKLEELAAEDRPVVSDPQDRFGTADDPDAADAATGEGAPSDVGDDVNVAVLGAAGSAPGWSGPPGGAPIGGGAWDSGTGSGEAADDTPEQPVTPDR